VITPIEVREQHIEAIPFVSAFYRGPPYLGYSLLGVLGYEIGKDRMGNPNRTGDEFSIIDHA
jgi:hypothetical protein